MRYCGSTTKTCYYYFNKETRELRWKLEDVKTKGYISFQLVCQVVDEDVLQGVKTGSYKNTLNVTQDGRYVDQTSTKDILINQTSLSKDLNAAVTGNTISFKLDVNKLGEDLDLDKDTLTIVDEMCSYFTLKPESLSYTDKNGKAVDVKAEVEVRNGITYMTFTVPDSKEVIITYDAKINAEEDEVIPFVSNKVHWKGKITTTPGIWSKENFSFHFSSSVTLSDNPSLKITKRNAQNVMQTLSGVEFKVQEATIDSDGKVTLTGAVHTGTTDANGVLYFSKQDGDKWLRRNRIYAVTETQAPEGFELAETQYILVATKGNKQTYDSRVEIQRNTNEYELDVYDEPITGYQLPTAGGTGTYPIMAAGAALITAGTVSYVYVSRRKKRRNS
jgi:LPXTG-motif cell wall-anchored protein